MFGATLALKGAIEEQLQEHPHCQLGCWQCAINAEIEFARWLKESRPFFNYRMAMLDAERQAGRLSDLTPRIP